MANTQNLDTMPLEELRKLALEESAQIEAESQQDKAPQARDGQGRFVGKEYQEEFDNSDQSSEPEVEADTAPQAEEEPEEYIYRREIDLGDGAGVRVYYGKGASKEEALEQLADKLAEAQKSAAKTIHDFQKKYPKEPEKPKAREFTADEEFIYRKEFENKPTEAFKKLFKEYTGYGIEDFPTKMQAIEAFELQQRSIAVQDSFVATHSDYVGTPSNGEKMKSWVQAHGFSEFTEDNLEKAYQDLKRSGLLQLKSEGADVATDEKSTGAERTVQPKQESTQQRSQKKGSTISTKGRTATAVTMGPSEDELYSMPMEQLRRLTNEQLNKANQE